MEYIDVAATSVFQLVPRLHFTRDVIAHCLNAALVLARSVSAFHSACRDEFSLLLQFGRSERVAIMVCAGLQSKNTSRIVQVKHACWTLTACSHRVVCSALCRNN